MQRSSTSASLPWRARRCARGSPLGCPRLHCRSDVAMFGPLSRVRVQGKKRGSYLFSIELSVYVMLTLLVSLLFSADGARLSSRGLFDGFKPISLVPATTTGLCHPCRTAALSRGAALGGLCVGQVVKYAGGVQRGFCVLLGILLTGLIEILIFAAPFSVAILVSLPLVLLGTYLHIAHPVCVLSGSMVRC